MSNTTHTAWKDLCSRDLELLTPLLANLGIELEAVQPHIGGERFLMQAVTTTSGPKLILLGSMHGDRVVVKATRDPHGMQELIHEHQSRKLLPEISFAYSVFQSPKEILFTRQGPFLISVQAFIEQDSRFLDRPIAEQCALALAAFKAQEGAHATTHEHAKRIRRNFGSIDAEGYVRMFASFIRDIEACGGDTTLLRAAQKELEVGKRTIDQYSGFLTHTDFVPHNFRVHNGTIYLLDHSSLRFGNKYEGWARFVNFMELHNPVLARALEDYVRVNHAPEESTALWLMRIYRLGEILLYYYRTLPKSEGGLHTLNQARIDLWSLVLKHLLARTPIPPSDIQTYCALRDRLRSDEEKLRQKDLL